MTIDDALRANRLVDRSLDSFSADAPSLATLEIELDRAYRHHRMMLYREGCRRAIAACAGALRVVLKGLARRLPLPRVPPHTGWTATSQDEALRRWEAQ
jgi:hypothetical protein